MNLKNTLMLATMQAADVFLYSFYIWMKTKRATFSNFDLEVKPKQGRLLMFPPTWIYLHTGHKPVIKNKYIIVIYLHYV